MAYHEGSTAPRRLSPTPIADYWGGLGIRFEPDEYAPSPAEGALYPTPIPIGGAPVTEAPKGGLSRLFASLSSKRKKFLSPKPLQGRFGGGSSPRPNISRPDIVVSPPLHDVSSFPSTASRNNAVSRGSVGAAMYQRSISTLSLRHRSAYAPTSPSMPPPLPTHHKQISLPTLPQSAPPLQSILPHPHGPKPPRPTRPPSTFQRGSKALPRYDPSLVDRRSFVRAADAPAVIGESLMGLGLDMGPLAPDSTTKGSRASSATLAYLAGTPPRDSIAAFETLEEVDEEEDIFGPLSPPKKLVVTNLMPEEAHSSDDDASPHTRSLDKTPPPPRRSPRPRSNGSQPNSRPNSRRSSRHRPHGSVTEEEEATAGDIDETRPRVAASTSKSSFSPPLATSSALRPILNIKGARLPSFRFSSHGMSMDEVFADLEDRMGLTAGEALETLTERPPSPVFARAIFGPGTRTPSLRLPSPRSPPVAAKSPSPTFVPVAASPRSSPDMRSSPSPKFGKVSPRPRVQSLLATVHLDALGLHLSPIASPAASPVASPTTSPVVERPSSRPASSMSVPVTVAEEDEEGPEVKVQPPTPTTPQPEFVAEESAPSDTAAPELPPPPPRPLTPSSSAASLQTSSKFSIAAASQTSLTSFGTNGEMSCEEAIDSMLHELARPHSPPDLLVTRCDDESDDSSSGDGERTPTPSTAHQSFSVYQDSALASLARSAKDDRDRQPDVALAVVEQPAAAENVRWSVDSKLSASSSVYGGADWDRDLLTSSDEESVLQRKRSVQINRVGAGALAKSVVVSVGPHHAPSHTPAQGTQRPGYVSRPLSIVVEEEADDNGDASPPKRVDPVPASAKLSNAEKRRSLAAAEKPQSAKAEKRQSARAEKRQSAKYLGPTTSSSNDPLLDQLLRRRSAFVYGRFDDVDDEADAFADLTESEDEAVIHFGERVAVTAPEAGSSDDDAASVVSFGVAY